MKDVVLIGSGGHAKVVIDILRETSGVALAGCVSRATAGEVTNGVPVLGGDELLPELRNQGST